MQIGDKVIYADQEMTIMEILGNGVRLDGHSPFRVYININDISYLFTGD